MRPPLRLALVAALLASAPVFAGEAPKAMSDDDFFLDRKSLIGSKVAVTGHLSVAGDITFLRLADESNATFVQTDDLPRDVRKTLRDRCKVECNAVVTGMTQVVQSAFGPDVGIKADTIAFQ